MKYVCLLRGINVGGSNIIKMADLRSAFERNGFTGVRTYIQSGNVIFKTPIATPLIEPKISNLLSETFSYTGRIMLLPQKKFKDIIDHVPSKWKKDHDIRCYIGFLSKGVDASSIIEEIPTNEKVDQLDAGPGALYMTTKKSGLTSSGFSRLTQLKIYQNMTIRNYRTSRKILNLLETP